MELASAPKADETHPDTKGETFDNLLRKILSSRVTDCLDSNRLSIFFILILVEFDESKFRKYLKIALVELSLWS